MSETSMARPTQILKDEHRIIEQVLDCVEVLAERCRERGDLDGDAAAQAIEFLREFADRCHHGKEEAQLFPMMESRGFPRDSGPVAVMLAEHVRGRALVVAMDRAREAAAAGEASACESFAGAAQAFVSLLREHIQKEDHCLFPMADQALTEADQFVLQQLFRRVEQEETGVEKRARLVALAGELRSRVLSGQATVSP